MLTRNRFGGGPSLRPNVASSARRCGADSRCSASQVGQHEPMQSGEGQAATPIAHPQSTERVTSGAESAAYCSRRVLPTPGSPMNTSGAAQSVADVVDECIQRRAVLGSPDQDRGFTVRRVSPGHRSCDLPGLPPSADATTAELPNRTLTSALGGGVGRDNLRHGVDSDVVEARRCDAGAQPSREQLVQEPIRRSGRNRSWVL